MRTSPRRRRLQKPSKSPQTDGFPSPSSLSFCTLVSLFLLSSSSSSFEAAKVFKVVNEVRKLLERPWPVEDDGSLGLPPPPLPSSSSSLESLGVELSFPLSDPSTYAASGFRGERAREHATGAPFPSNFLPTMIISLAREFSSHGTFPRRVVRTQKTVPCFVIA